MRQLLRWRPSSGWQTVLVVGLIVAMIALAGLVLILRFRGLTSATAALVTAVATIVGVLITQVAQAYLARSGHIQTLELESERAQDESLRKYFEQMGEWLTNEKLRGSEVDPNTRILARSQTLPFYKD